MSTKIFVNLPVKDLVKAMAFFAKLGYKFNPQFTDENAACMIVSEDIYVMLLMEKFFQTFTPKAVGDASKSTEVIVSLSVESREKVDELVNKALQHGGKPSSQTQDMGWMYQRGFQDVDGHLWEYIYMDESAIKPV